MLHVVQCVIVEKLLAVYALALAHLFLVSSFAAIPYLKASFSVPASTVIGRDATHVYVESNGKIAAVNVASSLIAWRRTGTTQSNRYVFTSEFIYILEQNRFLVALRSSTGKPIWRLMLPTSATVPTTLAVGGGRLAVGYDCVGSESAVQSSCLGKRSIIVVEINPSSGKLKWQMQLPAARKYGDIVLSSNFIARQASASTTANPDPQATYFVLPLPVVGEFVDESDLNYLEGVQETDNRPRFIVGNTLFTLGDPELRSASLDGSGRFNLETLALPAMRRQKFALEVPPRLQCGVSLLVLSRVEFTTLTPLLEAQLKDDCGDYKRFWSLGDVPLPIPNSTGQGTVFAFGGDWWGIAADTSRISRLTRTRIAIVTGKANLDRYVVFEPPYIAVRERADAPAMQLYDLKQRILIATLSLDKNVPYMPKTLVFEGKIAVFQEGRLSIFAIGNR